MADPLLIGYLWAGTDVVELPHPFWYPPQVMLVPIGRPTRPIIDVEYEITPSNTVRIYGVPGASHSGMEVWAR